MVQVVSFRIDTLRVRVLRAKPPMLGETNAMHGATYEAVELKNPVLKMNPGAKVVIRETEHLFYRLDLFQDALEKHANHQEKVWKVNV